MPNKTTKTISTNNFYIITALVVTLVVIAAVYFGQSLVKTALHNGRVLSKLNTANSTLDNNIVSAKKLITAYNELGMTKAIVKNSLPTTGDYPGLIALLENIGNTTGVTVKAVTAEAPALSATTPSVANINTSGAQAFNFGVELVGTYTQMLAFVQATQLSARPIDVISIDLSGTGSVMIAKIKGVAYYQPDSALPFSTENVK